MHHIIATATLCVLSVLPSLACTSFIVSGKATKSGRPMIFKNRDTGNLDNCMVTVKGERYRFMGVAAAKDSANTEIWSGHNEAGFAIMNTAAYNLNGDTEFEVETEGMLMRQALALCATLKDFEALLDTTSLRNNNANFGVIDAQGGCAYYEVGLHRWTKFDANDPNVAPYGFLIRTNHAYSGDRTMDLGTERYLAINKFMTQQAFAGCFDAPSLIRTVPRILTHGLTNVNILDLAPEDNTVPRFANFVDFIPRFSTSCAQLIEGVSKNEDPSHTVAWTIIGSPLATVAMPLLLLPNDNLPETVGRGTTGGSALCRYGLKLKERLFPLRTKTRSSYIDVAQLVNRKGNGILQLIRPIEDELMDKGTALVNNLRNEKEGNKKEGNKKDVYKAFADYYSWADGVIKEQYEKGDIKVKRKKSKKVKKRLTPFKGKKVKKADAGKGGNEKGEIRVAVFK